MLGRQVLLRLRGPIRLTSTNNLSSQQHPRATWSILSQTQRFYATPGRPRSTVGEPSRTVKRDVKRKARTPIAKGAAKKPAAKKKAAKPKPKPKPKPKKETEAQKVIALKKIALKPPPKRPLTAWMVFLGEKTRGKASGVISGRVGQIAADYKALSPAELEHYNHLAVQESHKRRAAYDTWINSHSVEDIASANAARKQIRRKTGQRTKYPAIEDARLPARPLNGHRFFIKERQASGDMKNIAVRDRMRLLGQEWQALSESEKSAYAERAKAI